MFLNILPDPNYKINDAGIEDANGQAGPGFAALSMGCILRDPIKNTYGGRSILSTNTRNHWTMSITYNPLIEEDFKSVYDFTLNRRGHKPFYVSMPQYKKPKDITFASFVETASITAAETKNAGAKNLEITESAWSANIYGGSGLPKTGDVFTITDSTDSLHKQVYMISHIDTHDLSETLPSSGNIRLHFFPGLQRKVTSGADINFDNPLFKVIQMGTQQNYTLDSDNLYNFTLKFEEALY